MTPDRLNRKDLNYPEELDAVVAAPESHKILFENENLRVVEVVIPPGQKEPIHTHKWRSVMIVDKRADINYYDKDGKPTEIVRDENAKLPIVENMEPEGPHAVENIDSTEYHAIRVEFKK